MSKNLLMISAKAKKTWQKREKITEREENVSDTLYALNQSDSVGSEDFFRVIVHIRAVSTLPLSS